MVSIIIDGKPADYNGGRIAYNLESNLLNTPKEITANWSHTFTLPRTLTNDHIFAQAWDVANVNARVRSWHAVTYIVDGVAMIDGRLAVVSIDESGYKCNIIWGFEALQEMKREGLKLWQLDTNNTRNDFVRLAVNPTISPRAGFRFGFADYESGLTQTRATALNLPRLYPSVTARYILDAINEKYGVTLNLSQEESEKADNLVIALTSNYIYRGDNYPRVGLRFWKTRDQFTGVWSYGWTITSNGNGIIMQNGDRADVQINGKVNGYYQFRAECVTDNFYLQSEAFGTFQGYREGGRYVCVINVGNEELARGENIAFSVEFMNPQTYPDAMGDFTITDLNFTYIPETEKAEQINLGLPIAVNLPDLTAWEFIAEVCAVLGVIPVSVNEAGSISVASWRDIANDPAVLDIQGVETYDTRANGFAQLNYYKFKNDTQGAPVIVDDDTIEAERTAWESKLNGVTAYNRVALWATEWDGAEFKAERVDAPPTLGTLNHNTQTAQVVSTGATWAEIIANNYTAYTSALNKPVYLTATAILPPATIKRINLTRGVLIRQLNAIFAVVKITASDNDLYKLELLKIS